MEMAPAQAPAEFTQDLATDTSSDNRRVPAQSTGSEVEPAWSRRRFRAAASRRSVAPDRARLRHPCAARRGRSFARTRRASEAATDLSRPSVVAWTSAPTGRSRKMILCTSAMLAKSSFVGGVRGGATGARLALPHEPGSARGRVSESPGSPAVPRRCSPARRDGARERSE